MVGASDTAMKQAAKAHVAVFKEWPVAAANALLSAHE
jgi:hypothetical protein